MINYDSILSAFDGKPTLLQWLKMVKKALDESILKNVGITQNGEKVVFTFNFEDGTSISTPEVTLPKGDKGDKGEQGVSITGIYAVSNEVVGDETLTTLRANYSNDTTNEFVVTAKNGKDSASGNNYLHLVKLHDSVNHNLYFNLYSRKETLTFEDLLEWIPTGHYGITATVEYGSEWGVLAVQKYMLSGRNIIKAIGTVYSAGAASGITFIMDEQGREFTDTVLGVNL